MKHKLHFISSLLMLVIVCSSNVWAKTFIDDMGRKIELNDRPARIISLAPSITEILFFLNLGEQIIGVTDFCNYPEEAQKKTSIGWIISPDVEKIIALKPDLVFATAEGNRQSIADTLERVHIQVYILDPHSLDDVLREIAAVGNMTGQEEAAALKVNDLKKRVDSIQKKVEGLRRIRVLYLASVDPLISAGPGSFIHDIITISGGDNVASASVTRYPKMAMEEIILRDPEIIIAPPDIIDRVNSWKSRWPDISAIRSNRIYSIDPDIISRPGPRIVDGLEQFYRYIHD